MLKYIEMTEESYVERSNDMEGICLACGEDAFGVEPDASSYKCEQCGIHEVYGFEQLLLMGKIEFIEGNDE